MKKIFLKVVCFFVIVGFVGGCATQTRLEPGRVETLEWSGEGCIGVCEGVRLIADPDAWRGAPEVIDHVTPIKITVKNRHGATLRLLYRHFALIAPDGKRFSALPPFDIKATAEPPSTPRPSGPPAFRSRYFSVSPHQHAFVPGVPTVDDPFPNDPIYYDRYSRTWKEIELPTDYMKSAALPEGDIQDQGEVTGFVYFEKVEGVKKVELHLDLMEADDGTIFGRIRAPFHVVE